MTFAAEMLEGLPGNITVSMPKAHETGGQLMPPIVTRLLVQLPTEMPALYTLTSVQPKRDISRGKTLVIDRTCHGAVKGGVSDGGRSW